MERPGQTIEAVARAEAVFLQKVNELHGEAEGKPFVIGNCQDGWALLLFCNHSLPPCGGGLGWGV